MAALQGTKRIWKQESEFKNIADTEEHRAMNRRTDVSFKIIESN